MATSSISTADVILGYSLEKKIGAGSYGEVWAAVAPGGIAKAVKFIFGCHDENRAQNELKSLNKIKQVRHPFLLSLERIEVVDGRLVIVTELADMSLNERYLRCREENLPGIPRTELLGYLKDAADALDYISDEHSLQHLDIKPENLLLMGGHIKVADFGLVKEVQDATASLMSGLTPAYAPPELFDGRPNRHSDQYSLAVVYAEMVGGERPFSGTTAAQLAVQHMQSKPNLTRLSPRDQGIVLKALAKSPGLRFNSCREFIEELTSRQGRTKVKKRRTNPNARADNDAVTVQLESRKATGTMMLGADALAGIRKPTSIQFQGPIACDLKDVGVHPTLFIGVGGTGTRIIRNLQARIRKQIGSDLPSVGCLCVDTDRRSLIESAEGGHQEAVNYNEILEIPLRKPEQYRNDAKMHLKWLSRRWIYNVPRSLQTEGIRPLGRLAFVDNSEALFTRLTDVVNTITTANAIAGTAEALGLNPVREAPRVYLVCSIAGGVGSGCIIDMAYAVRTALAEIGLSNDEVIGILTHSTAAYDRDAQLAVANTYACLTEWQHYASYGYPGDESCGLPEFEPDEPAFKHVYFVNFGAELYEDTFEQATSDVAEYLFHNAASGCQAFHHEVRRLDDCEPTTMRTLGIASTDFGFRGESSLFGVDLSLSLLEDWLTAKSFDADHFVDVISSSLHLSTTEIVESLTQEVADKRGADFIQNLVSTFLHSVQQAEEAGREWQSCVGKFDRMLGRHTDQTEAPTKSINNTLQTTVRERSHSISESVINAVFNLVNLPDVRIGGAHRAHDAVTQRLREVLDQLQKELEQLKHEQTQTLQEVAAQQAKSKDSRPPEPSLIRFAELRIRETTLMAARTMISTIGAQLSSTLPLMVNARRDVEAVRVQLAARREAAAKIDHCVSSKDESLDNDFRRILETEFREHLPTLLPRVNEQLERNFLSQANGLLGVLQDETGLVRRQLLPEIVAAAEAGVTQLMKNVDIEQLIKNSGITREALTSWVGEKLSEMMPRALELCGGNARLLLGLPESDKGADLVEIAKQSYAYDPTTIPGTLGDILFSIEGFNIPVSNIAYSLIEERPNCASIVSRLHTRSDVEWTKLTDVM